MTQPIISVEHLSKKYRIAHQGQSAKYSTLREALAAKSMGLVSRLMPGKGNAQAIEDQPSQEDFWALKDVSFEVQQGEVLGVVGRNGAGKSTLLKVLSRITEPTEGRVTLRGRIASLLEVGTGFHPELTGRENVYLNGAILGMSRAEIKRKFDEIVDFAGVEKFLDTPVKRYSSGMYVRLAFAVAAHLEPEILIVDEVLAVGDAEFQKKCLGKMQEVSSGGRTVIFVSHHIASVQRLCTRGLFLQNGRVAAYGPINETLDSYLSGSKTDSDGRRQIEVADDECKIISWHTVNDDGSLAHSCLSRQLACFRLIIESKRVVPSAQLSFVVRSLSGDLLVAATSKDDFQEPIDIPIGFTEILIKVRLPLKMGRYQVDLAVKDAAVQILDHWLAEPLLSVLPNHNTTLPPEWHGLINERVSFEVCKGAKATYEFAG